MTFKSPHNSSILIHHALIYPFKDELINLVSEWVVTAVLLWGRGTRWIELEDAEMYAGRPKASSFMRNNPPLPLKWQKHH